MEIVCMLKKLDKYKKSLNLLKINKFDNYKHRIDKNQIIQSYKNFSDIINNEFEQNEHDLEDLIRYENWLLGE